MSQMNRRSFLLGAAASVGALATVDLAVAELRIIGKHPALAMSYGGPPLHPNCRCMLTELEKYNWWGYAEGARKYGPYNWRRA